MKENNPTNIINNVLITVASIQVNNTASIENIFKLNEWNLFNLGNGLIIIHT